MPSCSGQHDREVLIVALSGRALAAAARRAGYHPLVLDLFHDQDTQALATASAPVPGDLAAGFKAKALLAAADQLAPQGRDIPLIYGSGFEGRPRLLARLAKGRRLVGNRPDQVAALKDPHKFFPLLERLGITYPEVRYTPPPDPRGWLVKRAGASGGGHIRPATAASAARRHHYFQRYLPGRPVSALFLANGHRALVVAWSEQWPARSQGSPFIFGGALRPAQLGDEIQHRLAEKLSQLVSTTGLVGLNSADFVVAERDAALLEVNPRPGATLDIAEGQGPSRLFDAHRAACDGRLPDNWHEANVATAIEVIYAPERLVIPLAMSWPDWAADLPSCGAAIAAGMPICTIKAQAASPKAVRRLLQQRQDLILDAITGNSPFHHGRDDYAVAGTLPMR